MGIWHSSICAMPEIPKRLAPTLTTLRELFLKSGNLCAFPGCQHLVMNADGVFIADLCHIEAAEPGGERFNPNMTNEQRRAFDNLLMMCGQHHRVTDDVTAYPVATLQRFKADHERRFSDPDRVILAGLKDWTLADQPTIPTNLRRFNRVLGWGHSEEELTETLTDFVPLIETLQRVPVGVRKFVAEVALRMHRLRRTRMVSDVGGHSRILITDLQNAFQMGDRSMRERLAEIDLYGIGGLDDIDTDVGPQPALALYRSKHGGWPIWVALAEFCEKGPESMDELVVNLDFARLDEDP